MSSKLDSNSDPIAEPTFELLHINSNCVITSTRTSMRSIRGSSTTSLSASSTSTTTFTTSFATISTSTTQSIYVHTTMTIRLLSWSFQAHSKRLPSRVPLRCNHLPTIVTTNSIINLRTLISTTIIYKWSNIQHLPTTCTSNYTNHNDSTKHQQYNFDDDHEQPQHFHWHLAT